MKTLLMKVLLLTGVGLIVLSPTALPCSCDGSPTLDEALEKSHSVFRGSATAIELDPSAQHYLRITFTVTGYWKGPVTQSYSILTYEGTGAGCGYAFPLNTEFLVFAYASDLGSPVTGECTRNKPIFLAAEDLRELGPALTPPQSTTWGLLKSHMFAELP